MTKIGETCNRTDCLLKTCGGSKPCRWALSDEVAHFNPKDDAILRGHEDATPLPEGPKVVIDAAPTTTRRAPDSLLRLSAELFERRNAQYGGNYKQFGGALLALFPEHLVPLIETAEDANRLNIVMMCLAKLQRYCHVWDAMLTSPTEDRVAQIVTARDCCRDLQVYAAMLEELT